MSDKPTLKPIAAALGTTFAVALAASPLVNAQDNPFGLTDLSKGYMVAEEGKCGEGKCGEGKDAGKDAGEGACGEGKDAGEGACGEGKDAGEGACGEGKDAGEGACGEGKDAGEGKCGG